MLPDKTRSHNSPLNRNLNRSFQVGFHRLMHCSSSDQTNSDEHSSSVIESGFVSSRFDSGNFAGFIGALQCESLQSSSAETHGLTNPSLDRR